MSGPEYREKRRKRRWANVFVGRICLHKRRQDLNKTATNLLPKLFIPCLVLTTWA